MTTLLIIAAMLLCIGLLLSIRIKAVLSYQDAIRAELRILFFRFPLYPKKEKRVRISDYRYKCYRKRLLRQRKRLREKERAEEKKLNRTKKNEPKLKDRLSLYLSLVTSLYERFFHHFRMDVSRLRIMVATGDAAETAILTGAVSGLVACTAEILSEHTNLRRTYRADIAVIPDFLSERSRVDCRIVFSLRLYQIVDLGIRFAYHFLTKHLKKSAHDA